ncbi:MAG: hypothetical protein HYT48_01685 [Candidatus Vogelbacteria bacterium]|nr:hypothetical protein [Candidatus Vogelbacteria bacterium]
MLEPAIGKLVAEVFRLSSRYSTDELVKRVKADPEAYLVSLLLRIKEELPEVSATLKFTVQMGEYESGLQEAGRLLGRPINPAAFIVPPSRKVTKGRPRHRRPRKTTHA